MTEDLRSRAKIPYGYQIVNGVATIQLQEAMALTVYFQRFLEGLPMSQSAKEAKLPCSATTLRHLFYRKEYIGTDFYPPIITEEYQKQLIAEYESRKGKQVRVMPTHPKKGVRIYKAFVLKEPDATIPKDPAACAAALYQRIRPKLKKAETKAPGK